MSRIYKKLEVPPKKALALSKAIQEGKMPEGVELPEGPTSKESK